jgi:hypothetical protein
MCWGCVKLFPLLPDKTKNHLRVVFLRYLLRFQGARNKKAQKTLDAHFSSPNNTQSSQHEVAKIVTKSSKSAASVG